MKKNFLFLFAFILFTSLTVAQKEEKFGAELTLKEKTKISEILSNPKKYEGKAVQVEGKVLDVCAAAGCWMELSSDKADQKIKIKVKDGDIVFPMEAKEKTALVEGSVYEIKLTKEEALEYYEHMAKESGNKFDPSTVTGPVTFYQIKGKGAVIR